MLVVHAHEDMPQASVELNASMRGWRAPPNDVEEEFQAFGEEVIVLDQVKLKAGGHVWQFEFTLPKQVPLTIARGKEYGAEAQLEFIFRKDMDSAYLVKAPLRIIPDYSGLKPMMCTRNVETEFLDVADDVEAIWTAPELLEFDPHETCEISVHVTQNRPGEEFCNFQLFLWEMVVMFYQEKGVWKASTNLREILCVDSDKHLLTGDSIKLDFKLDLSNLKTTTSCPPGIVSEHLEVYPYFELLAETKSSTHFRCGWKPVFVRETKPTHRQPGEVQFAPSGSSPCQFRIAQVPYLDYLPYLGLQRPMTERSSDDPRYPHTSLLRQLIAKY